MMFQVLIETQKDNSHQSIIIHIKVINFHN